MYDPYAPAHWQIWPGLPAHLRPQNITQSIPSNIDENARQAAIDLAQKMGLTNVPDDGGKSQGGNLWRYTAMIERGLIKPPEEGKKGWKSADELRNVLCYVSYLPATPAPYRR